MKNIKNIILLIVGIIIGLCVGYLILLGIKNGGVSTDQTGDIGTDQKFAPAVGAMAPDLELSGMDGNKVQLSSLVGVPIFINFWASWCGPCQAEMPLIEKAYLAHPADLIILGINDDEPEDVVGKYILDNHMMFKVLLDPGETAMQAYRVTGLPTSFFIDREGVIRHIQVGALDESSMAVRLSQIGVGK